MFIKHKYFLNRLQIQVGRFKQKRSARYLIYLKLVITFSFILLGLLFIESKNDEFLLLEWPSNLAITIVGTTFIANIYLRSLFNKIMMFRLGVCISISESFMLSCVTTAGNFLLPFRGGAGLRAIYMKKLYKLPYSHFASSLAIFQLVNISFISIVGCLILIYFFLSYGYFRYELFLILIAIFIFTAWALLVRRGKEHSGNLTHQNWSNSFFDGYRSVTAEREFLFIAVKITATSFIFATISWTVALLEYETSIRLDESILLAVSQLVSGMITITPGATGFQEISGLYVGQQFQTTIVELFAILIWTKSLKIIISIFLATPAIILLKKRIASIDNSDNIIVKLESS